MMEIPVLMGINVVKVNVVVHRLVVHQRRALREVVMEVISAMKSFKKGPYVVDKDSVINDVLLPDNVWHGLGERGSV